MRVSHYMDVTRLDYYGGLGLLLAGAWFIGRLLLEILLFTFAKNENTSLFTWGPIGLLLSNSRIGPILAFSGFSLFMLGIWLSLPSLDQINNARISSYLGRSVPCKNLQEMMEYLELEQRNGRTVPFSGANEMAIEIGADEAEE